MLQKNGYLMDITEDVVAKKWIDKSIEGAVEFNNLRTPGKYYSVPFLMAPVVVFYNKDIFEKAGLKPPATWADFEAMLPVLKKAGYIPFEAYSSQLMFFMYDMVMNAVPFADVNDWYYLRSTSPAFASAFTESIGEVESWIKAGYFRKNLSAISGDSIISLFAQGRARC